MRVLPLIMLGFWLAALLVYRRALTVSFLSDDWYHLAFARYSPFDAALFAPDQQRWLFFFRPLGLLCWKLLYAGFGDWPVGYRCTGLLLHATAAALLVALLCALACPRSRAATTGVLFLLFPASVETVVWLSAWYDLLLVVTYLSTLVCALRYWQTGARWQLGLVVLCAQLCVWSKEPAFSLPLVLLACWWWHSPRAPIPQLLRTLGAVCLPLMLNLAHRVVADAGLRGYENAVPTPLALAGALAKTLAMLAAPLHQTLFPAALVGSVLIGSGILGSIGIWRAGPNSTVRFAAVWLLATLAPLLTVLPVLPDLQNSRYLYLPAVGWCIAVVELGSTLCASLQQRLPKVPIVVTVFVVLVGAHVAMIQRHIEPWHVASTVTNQVLRDVAPQIPPGLPLAVVQVAGLPDNYQGAYSYRIGLDAALLLRYQLLVAQWPVFALQPMLYDSTTISGDLVQITGVFDERNERTWRATFGRGRVDSVAAQLPPDHWLYTMRADYLLDQLPSRSEAPPVARWSAADCATLRAWRPTNATLRCDSTGLLVDATTTDPFIDVQTNDQRLTPYVEVRITLRRTQPASDPSKLCVYWQTPQRATWSEQATGCVELPPDNRTQTLRLHMRLGYSEPVLRALRIDPTNQREPLIVSAIEVRPLSVPTKPAQY